MGFWPTGHVDRVKAIQHTEPSDAASDSACRATAVLDNNRLSRAWSAITPFYDIREAVIISGFTPGISSVSVRKIHPLH